MSQSSGLSIRAYAAHRKALGLPGASATSVQKAIKSGRISRNPEGKIDPEKADADWVSSTLPSVPAGGCTPGTNQKPRNGSQDGASADLSLVDARIVLENFKAMMAELDYMERAGHLGRVAEMREESFRLARSLRDSFNGVPERLASICANESDPQKIANIIREEIRSILKGVVTDG